jgi:hypothetical protein
MIAQPKITYNPKGDIDKATLLKGVALQYWAFLTIPFELSDVKSNKQSHTTPEGIRFYARYRKDAYGNVNGEMDVFVPKGFGGEELSGFLIKNRWTAADEAANPAHVAGTYSGMFDLLRTSKKGFIGLEKRIPFLGKKLNTWTNGKKIVTWGYFANLCYNGRELDTGYYLPFRFILAAAITNNNKLVILTTSSEIMFFSLVKNPANGKNITILNTDTSALASVTVLDVGGGGRQDPAMPSFNNDGTKLVFIGKNATVSAYALPFTTTLTNDDKDINYQNPGYLSADELSPPPTFGYGSLTAGEIATLQEYWQVIYRVDIDVENNTAAIFSETPQYAKHAYKATVTNTATHSFATNDKVINDGAAVSTVTALHNIPFVSHIWFDINGVEKTEVATSSCSLAMNCSYTVNYHRDFVDVLNYTQTITGTYDRTIEYELNTYATSDHGVIHERTKRSGVSSADQTETVILTAGVATSGVVSATGDNNENLITKRFVQATGYSKYINNVFHISANFDENSSVITPGADYDILGFSGSETYGLAVNYDPFTVLFDNLPSYSTVDSLTGDIQRKTHSTTIGVHAVNLQYPSSSKTVNTVNENFIFTDHRKTASDADNFMIQVQLDKHQNYLYAMKNTLKTTIQYGVYGYKTTRDSNGVITALFVPESPEIQAKIAAEVLTTDDIVGVM